MPSPASAQTGPCLRAAHPFRAPALALPSPTLPQSTHANISPGTRHSLCDLISHQVPICHFLKTPCAFLPSFLCPCCRSAWNVLVPPLPRAWHSTPHPSQTCRSVPSSEQLFWSLLCFCSAESWLPVALFTLLACVFLNEGTARGRPCVNRRGASAPPRPPGNPCVPGDQGVNLKQRCLPSSRQSPCSENGH